MDFGLAFAIAALLTFRVTDGLLDLGGSGEIGEREEEELHAGQDARRREREF